MASHSGSNDDVTSLSSLEEETGAILTGIEATAGVILAWWAEEAGRAKIQALMAETLCCNFKTVQLFSELQIRFQSAAEVGKLVDEMILCLDHHHSGRTVLSSLMQRFKEEAANSCRGLADFASELEKISEQQEDTKLRVDRRQRRARRLSKCAKGGKYVAGAVCGTLGAAVMIPTVLTAATLDAVQILGGFPSWMTARTMELVPPAVTGLGSILKHKCDERKEVYKNEVYISAVLSSQSENLDRVVNAMSDLQRTIQSAADGFGRLAETASTADRDGRQAVVQEAKRLRARLDAYEVFARNLRVRCERASAVVMAAVRHVYPQQN